MIATDDGELFDEIDVKFDLGNGNIYSEIRAFWAAHSDVFKAMLFGKMQESKKYSVIPLEDITPKVMEFLKVSIPFHLFLRRRNPIANNFVGSFLRFKTRLPKLRRRTLNYLSFRR